MKRLGTFTAALLLTSALTPVYAQQPVTVIGTVIPGNCVQWFSTTQLKDPGVTCNGGASTSPGGSNLQIQYNNAGNFGGLTDVQVTARIQAATASLSGALPAWPNNTTTFFRGDGTYASLTASNMPAGVPTNALNAQTSAYALVSSDCGKTVSLGGSAFYALTVGAASGFPATCTVNVVNIDTTRGKLMTINGTNFPLLGILWPTMSFTLNNQNNVWTVTGLGQAWKITSPVTFNVDTATGVDGSNDCLGALGTSGACATLGNAVATFCQIANVVNAQVTFQLKTGQTAGLQTLCTYQSSDLGINTNTPTIVGDTSSCTNAANYTINGLGPVGVNTAWIVEGVKIAPHNGFSVLADNHSILSLGSSVTFPTVSGFHVTAQYDSFVEFVGNYCITGGATAHSFSNAGGKILAQPTITVTLSGTPAFTSFFADSALNGFQEWGGVTFSGSATGPRYSATTGGGIDTNGGGATFLPGNSSGTATSPGWYN